MTPFEIVIIKDELNIVYHGWIAKNNPEKIYLVCGFGPNWDNTQKIEMHKIEEYFIAKVKILNNNSFNFCFCNEKDEWDNNDGNDSYDCSGVLNLSKSVIDIVCTDIENDKQNITENTRENL